MTMMGGHQARHKYWRLETFSQSAEFIRSVASQRIIGDPDWDQLFNDWEVETYYKEETQKHPSTCLCDFNCAKGGDCYCPVHHPDRFK